jgi:hypothetical protein
MICPAKAYQVEVEDSACVVGLWPEIQAWTFMFSLE